MTNYLSLKNRIRNINSDIIGAVSAFLCIIHCAIVPILMGFHSVYYAENVLTHGSQTEHSHFSLDSLFEGIHWHSLDYFFIIITLMAVFFATHKGVILWIKISLWSCASLFVASILLESHIEGAEYLAYLASILLIVFHSLNQRLGKKLKADNLKKEELNFNVSSLEDKVRTEKSNKISCVC